MKYILIIFFCVCIFGSGNCGAQLSGADRPDSADDSLQERLPAGSRMVESADKQARFDLLYAASKDIYNSYHGDVMKALAFLIIALGWFITSNKSRDFFRKSKIIRIAAIFALLILCLAHVLYCLDAYNASQEKMSLIHGLNYLDREYYQSYEITTSALIANLALNLALFSVLILILCTLKAGVEKSADAGLAGD